MAFVKITKQEMDSKLKSEKGWYCSRTGNEYAYDFHLKSYPIIIKVSSTIKIDSDRPCNKGSENIRIFAVRKESRDHKAKIVSGLVKARRVHKMTDWRLHLEKEIYSVIQSSKVVYERYRRKNVQGKNSISI